MVIEKDNEHWIELSRGNFFCVSLYRCLMPALTSKKFDNQDEIQSLKIESMARVAVAKVGNNNTESSSID